MESVAEGVPLPTQPPSSRQVELRCLVDRCFGISRDVGRTWLEAARFGNFAQLKKTFADVSCTNDATAARLLHYNGQGTSLGFVGNTALHWASATGDRKMVEYLLAHGSSASVQNHACSTPLHTACAHGQVEVIPLLLSHGASTTVVDCCGDTPLEVAPTALRSQISRMFRQSEAACRLLSAKIHFEGDDAGWRRSWKVADMKAVVSAVGGDDALAALSDRGELEAAAGRILVKWEERTRENAARDAFAAELLQSVEKELKQQQQKAVRDDGAVGCSGGNATQGQERELAASAKQRGNDAFRDGDYRAAARYYTVAIRMDSSDATFFANRAAAYMKLQRYSMALRDAGAAVSRSPSWPKAHYRAGVAYCALGRVHDARTALKKGLEILQQSGTSAASDVAMFEEALQSCDEARGAARCSTAGEEGSAESSSDATEEAEVEATPMEQAAPPVQVPSSSAPSPPFVPVGQRRPWFTCSLCENTTRDAAETPCCRKQLCGTCLRRRYADGSTCPYCGACASKS